MTARDSVLVIILGLILAAAGYVDSTTIGFGTPAELNPALECFEDELRAVVVGVVQPDNGIPPDVEWGPGNHVGTEICITVDDINWDRFEGVDE
jgi:hypothetical protein